MLKAVPLRLKQLTNNSDMERARTSIVQQSLDHRSDALPSALLRRCKVLDLTAKYRQWINIKRGCALRKRGSVILI